MSWLAIPPESPFSLANVPFGIVSFPSSPAKRPAIAIGDFVLDLRAFSKADGFSKLPDIQEYLEIWDQDTLNSFAELGQSIHQAVRKYLQQIFEKETSFGEQLRDNPALQLKALLPIGTCQTHLPMHIGDYTDFYAGLHHAYAAGVLFRGPENALQPNYKHIPIGYHGRASTIVPSGTPIRRPNGQLLMDPAAEPKAPTLGACKKLDIELELAAFVCKSNKMGQPVPISQAKGYIFGLVLMNDWSARDIQAWEYVPLGPFLGKSFGTTISPWVVLIDALEPFLAPGIEPGNRETILPYLQEPAADNVYDIRLEVDLVADGTSSTICRTSGKNLLFSFPQMLAHHTINGCAMNSGDLLGSGTISGTEPGSQGSLLEQTKNGKQAISVGAATRTFLQDGDSVIIKGTCGQRGAYVGFGECRGRITPALTL